MITREQAQRIVDRGMFSPHTMQEFNMAETIVELYERIKELEEELRPLAGGPVVAEVPGSGVRSRPPSEPTGT